MKVKTKFSKEVLDELFGTHLIDTCFVCENRKAYFNYASKVGDDDEDLELFGVFVTDGGAIGGFTRLSDLESDGYEYKEDLNVRLNTF